MNATKKVLAIILASTLFTSSFVTCGYNLARHKKNISVIAYSTLCSYSLNKLLATVFKTVDYKILQARLADRYPENGNFQTPMTVAHIINAAKFALFSFLTYFSAKNIIEELREKKQNKEDTKNKN